MKELILKELHLENFQKFKDRKFEFGPVETHIIGENRAGKTTVQSAMLWLLFGKDANGTTDTGRGAFDIKRRCEGEIVHADVSVQGVFLLDGETIILKRILHENYNKKNEYSGDETQCFVNYTPYQLGEYKKFIESIISEEEFRMITNVEYFLSLKPDFQRKYLCAMGGVQPIQDICSSNKTWKEFMNSISGKSIDDALKQISYERKELKKRFEKIPVSIQSLEKVKPEPMDWESLEMEKEGLSTLLEEINESIGNENKAVDSVNKEIASLLKESSEKRKEFYSLTVKLQEARQEAKSEAYRILEKKNESRREAIKELDMFRQSYREKTDEMRNLEKKVLSLNNSMDKCFKSYKELQESTFQYDEKENICPLLHSHVCDSPALLEYLAKNREKAESEFNMKKQENILERIEQGKAFRKERDAAKYEMQRLAKELETILESVCSMENRVKSMPDFSIQSIDESLLEIPGKEEINRQMQHVNRQISEMEERIKFLESSGKTDNTHFISRRNELNRQLETVIKNLSLRSQIEKIEHEISSLNQEADRLAEQISELETRESIAKDINKAVVEDATERVNRLFTVIKWQMFEIQKNGDYAEVCKPTIEGVSKSLNYESRINAGIDVCNAISRFKGFTAPLFIDNHESVNESIITVGQSIKCFVAPKGTKLNIKIIK